MSDIKSIIGPGSQPERGEEGQLEYMTMPSEMMTFAMPEIPEPEDTQGMEQGKAVLERVHQALRVQKASDKSACIDLKGLSPIDIGLINQVLGEGEVAIVAGNHIQAQESVLAGVWRVHTLDDDGKLVRDAIEIGACPSAVLDVVFEGARTEVEPLDDNLPEGVFNAPPLVSELQDKVAAFTPDAPAHVINLSLLPQTEQDLEYLQSKLGRGHTTILSRGYGNCRITSTATENVWWVQYYNSQDALILNSIEVIEIPEVVCAAQEDIDESAERLAEILEVYR